MSLHLELEKKLDDRNLETRISSLKQLKEMADNNEIKIEKPESPLINLHCHTFYSFNAYGYSPCHIAWIAYQKGFEMIGIVDFDVIDGMDEFLQAGDILGNKVVVGMETRVFIPEYSDKVINSPNEPGVSYYVGMGFTHRPEKGTNAETILLKIGEIAKQRNISILNKLNPYLSPLKLNYDNDIIPLTISGNATERHLLLAFYNHSKQAFKNSGQLSSFWAGKLNTSVEEINNLIQDEYKLFDLMRGKLIKHGGIGYIQSDPENFPDLDEVRKMMNEMNVLPSPPFLNGLSEGESDIPKLLKFYKEKGDQVFSIIPDRNWNIADPDLKEKTLNKFNEFMQEIKNLGLKVVVGTELNKRGQEIVDDLTVPALAPFKDDFVNGADFVYNHIVNQI